MFADASVLARFDCYLEHVSSRLGHVGRREPFRRYCQGLLVTPGRKSVEPMAACLSPDQVSAAHQSLLHIVGQSPWKDEVVLAAVRDWVLPKMVSQSPVEAWIIDDTGLPKKGRHSVGVTRQYCGQSGKRDNCQVAVSLSVCTDQASLPVAWQLYLPQSWAGDAARRAEVGIPDDVEFKTKPRIAMDQISAAREAGIAPGVVLMDAAYGNASYLRQHIHDLDLHYSVHVTSDVTVWHCDEVPQIPPKRSRRGRQPSRLRREDGQGPLSVKELALTLGDDEWQTITWREGTNASLSGRFAAVRVHHAPRHLEAKSLERQEWLLIEWPQAADEPVKYWLSNLSEETDIADLVQVSKMRWRVERDYQELKQELGLGHFEGRLWRGFHHHASLCVAAYGFLIAERAAISPSADIRHHPIIKKSALPKTYKPRGSSSEGPASRA